MEVIYFSYTNGEYNLLIYFCWELALLHGNVKQKPSIKELKGRFNKRL